MDHLLTGPEVAALCGVDPATVRKWKERGIITPDGLDDRGRPLYRQLTAARAERATRDRARRTVGSVAA
ncbi:MerR family transcriptional regulator [Kitasatospora sp. NPDC058406]|uniref:MerR family transcriptional regulator n=1 Tax=Kitasatospora sp. NPDC058406 TaxID=3346483 RepID=UPI003657F764